MPKKTSKQQSLSLQSLLPFFAYITQLSDISCQTHQERASKISLQLSECLGIDQIMRTHISLAATVHDCGKLAIPASILYKYGKFTDAERIMMETHPIVGANMLRLLANAGMFVIEEPIITMVLQHHENYDGTGYPYRIKNSKIHIGARVLRICDYYEAITTQNRSYRSILNHQDALALMTKNKNCFDPEFFTAFANMDFTGLEP
jgi:HD-GYP domain-containing protein (c-di-GMP phosphodiesterase class II)